jgi:hypothetical protein
LQQLQFRCRLKQTTEGFFRNIAFPRQFRRAARTGRKAIKQLKLDAGRKDLRVHKTGRDIEKLPRATTSNPSGRRKTQNRSMKVRRTQKTITPGEQPVCGCRRQGG